MASISDNYISSLEHSAEDIKQVTTLEIEEQNRRLEDLSGETQRKKNAHDVSELFSNSTRSSWFNKGSSIVFQILDAARSKASDISTLATQKGRETAIEVKFKLDAAGQKGRTVALDVKDIVGAAGNKGIKLSSEFTAKAGQKGKETAHDIKLKVSSSTQDAHTKGIEVMSGVQQVIKEKLGIAQASLQEAAHQGMEKVQDAATKFKTSSLDLFGKMNLPFLRKTDLAFLLLEEETERTFRMNSDTETYAILNAMAVSRLIKEIGFEFYRPASEPSRAYCTRLLEDIEQTRRSLNGLSDRTAIMNAKAVSKLVEHKFRATTATPAALVVAKAEVVEEIKQGTYILNAAM